MSLVPAMTTMVCVQSRFNKHIFFKLSHLPDSYRGYDRSPPRSRDHRHGGKSHSYRQAPPDPHTFDAPASLKQYADWFRHYFPQQAIDEDQADKLAEQEAGDGTRPRNGIKSRWERYKKDFLQKQVSSSSSFPIVCPIISCTIPSFSVCSRLIVNTSLFVLSGHSVASY